MSNIEENAFQITRYLLENSQEDGQVAIRDALELSSEDFGLALKFLVDGGYCTTYGQPQGRESGIKRNLARLQEFFNQINNLRVPLNRNAERLLKYLFNDQSDFPFSVGDHIMSKFNWTKEQYVQAAQELGDKEFVRGGYASGNPFFKIFILPEGRETIRNNFRSTNSSQNYIQIEKFVANINDNKGIVNIGSTLTSVYQSLEVNSYIDSSSKLELEKLLQELENVLKEVPNDKVDEAEVVAEMVKSLIESATKEKPNKKLIEFSIENLKKAAEDLSIIIPSVLLISEKIISFILTFSTFN